MPQSSDVTMKPYPNFIDFVEEYNIVNQEGGVEFRNGKKPESLVAFYIEIFTSEGDIILDYHLGSGTTAATAHKMQRKYIGIEQMDYIETIAVNRLKNVISGDQSGISKAYEWQGGGSFVYCELAKANQTFVDVITQATTAEALSAIWQDMKARAFISYKVDVKQIDATKAEFAELSLDDQKRFLITTLDQNMLYIPLSEMDDVMFGVSDADKALNKQFFNLGGV
jgi:adenine-specific DNA-methyltransferase